MRVERSELHSWLSHPLTEKLYKKLRERKSDELRSLLGINVEKHAEIAKQIGVIEGIDIFLEIDLEEVKNDSETESDRTSSIS